MTLRYLFLDMNAFFASVEQHDFPALRGRPVAVAPVNAETTCCIAASYEAKPFGVRTGTPVREARRIYPGLEVRLARPERYIRIHDEIVAAVDVCLPVTEVLSIDEMVCALPIDDSDPERAEALGRRVKESIYRRVGPQMRCSVGLAPNRFLAKIASDLQKPDGLSRIDKAGLPDKLFALELRDFPGIGRRMENRLRLAGVTCVEELCLLNEAQLARIWGSKRIGSNWWHQLRGYDLSAPPTRRRSLGHSHVLSPQLRRGERPQSVLMRLVHKAAARLRHIGYWAGSFSLSISWLGGGRWQAQQNLMPCQDTLTFVRVAAQLWQRRPPGTPLKVGLVLGDLQANANVSQLLFEQDHKLQALSETMDRINRQGGACKIYFAPMHGSHGHSPTRIAFTTIPDLSLDDP